MVVSFEVEVSNKEKDLSRYFINQVNVFSSLLEYGCGHLVAICRDRSDSPFFTLDIIPVSRVRLQT